MSHNCIRERKTINRKYLTKKGIVADLRIRLSFRISTNWVHQRRRRVSPVQSVARETSQVAQIDLAESILQFGWFWMKVIHPRLIVDLERRKRNLFASIGMKDQFDRLVGIMVDVFKRFFSFRRIPLLPRLDSINQSGKEVPFSERGRKSTLRFSSRDKDWRGTRGRLLSLNICQSRRRKYHLPFAVHCSRAPCHSSLFPLSTLSNDLSENRRLNGTQENEKQREPLYTLRSKIL